MNKFKVGDTVVRVQPYPHKDECSKFMKVGSTHVVSKVNKEKGLLLFNTISDWYWFDAGMYEIADDFEGNV